jgi:hypothetical protein
MEMLMKEAEMYFRFGEKEKALVIMAKVEHVCQQEDGKEDAMPKPLSRAPTPLARTNTPNLPRTPTPIARTNTPNLPLYTFVPVVQLQDDVVVFDHAEEDEIPHPTTPTKPYLVLDLIFY